jgi:CBS domain containing-hemolysin-like protein
MEPAPGMPLGIEVIVSGLSDLSVFRVVLVFLLVFVNAFFVAAEFSLVTVRRTRVEQLVAERHPLAATLRRAVDNPSSYIATTQLGVTIASLALGWIGEPTLASVLEPLFGFLPPTSAEISAHSVAAVVSFIVITSVDIVLGELIPKNLALQRSENVAILVIEPLVIFRAIFRPFVWALTSAGTLGLHLFGLSTPPHHGLVYSVDELKMLVTASRQAGELEENEEDMIERVFNFDELHAHEVMVPRTEMVSVPVEASVFDVFELAGKTHHARFPVYRGTVDDIVGVVYVVDLLRRPIQRELRKAAIQPFLREALVLPETVPVDVLIDQMRQHKTHLAILVDEYGGTAGLVTLLDVIERIIGRVPDQFEAAPPEIQVCPDGSLLVDGLANLDDVNEQAHLNLESDLYDTIGGFVLGEIGRRPEVGDTVTSDGTRFQVEAVDGLRIAKVRIWPSRRETEETEKPNEKE